MNDRSNPHHLVLGELNDFLTGAVITDTFDERYRQKIARKLVFDGKFKQKDIQGNVFIPVSAGRKKAVLKIDFLVNLNNKFMILIKYAPGSLVTRRLSTLALSRIYVPYQIPFAIITNGENAEIIDGNTGKIIASGLDNLPSRKMLLNQEGKFSYHPIKKTIFDQASRIAFACEVDGACPCDSDICTIE